MQEILFYFFAGMVLLCGFLVVANPCSRNPVTSAMFLVLSIVSLAGLFVLLHAFFLAAVQVLVYAGAVMVLFLFVIMLLDLGAEQRRALSQFGLISGLLGAGMFALILLGAVVASGEGGEYATATLEGRTEPLGRLLFTGYLLPFEVLSVLLLVAMVGAVLLSKRDLS